MHATLAAALGGPQLADTGAWIWAAVIIFWIVSSIVTSIRQAAKKASQRAEATVQSVEQQPSVQRLQTAAQQIGSDVQADVSNSSSQLGARPLDRSQYSDLGKQLLAQIEAARQAAAARVATAQAPPAASVAPQILSGTLPSTLAMQAAQAASAMSATSAQLTQPVRPSFSQGLGPALHAPGGLAFAILAATIIGPCTALKTQPQEPGGW